MAQFTRPVTEPTCCVTHGMPCRVETNKHGCRDFVCGRMEDRCNFRRPVQKVNPRSCSRHNKETYVVTYERHYRMRDGTKRCYYRCNGGSENGDQWWCGYDVIEEIDRKATDPNVNNGVIDSLERQLQAKKKLIATVKLSALPDGGASINADIDKLAASLAQQKLNADSSRPAPVNPAAARQPEVIASTSRATAWPPTMPVFYGGNETTNTRRELMSSAIEKIHSSVESKPDENTETADPELLTVTLMPHQRRALSWLLWRESQQPSGGIFADDMGLGKTLTMLALILLMRRLNKNDESENRTDEWKSKSAVAGLVPSSATLVVCPASLLHHWEQEAKRHCSAARLNVVLFHGGNRNDYTISRLVKCDIIVTTYDIVRCEINPSKSSKISGSVLQRIEFNRIILDEGHVIKNPKSNTSLAVCTLESRSRWIVTGTPIHNKLSDMFSLLKFLRCSPFDDFKVWKYWVDNRTLQGQQRLATVVSSLLLRRIKSDVGLDGQPLVSLPMKTVHDLQLTLGKEELEVYSIVFSRAKAMLRSYMKSENGDDVGLSPTASAGPDSSGASNAGPKLIATGGGDNGMVSILVQLLRLRQCCCHLSLLRKSLQVTDNADDKKHNDADDALDDIIAQMQTGFHIEHPPDDGLGDILIDVMSGKLGVAFEKSHCSTKIKALLAKLNELGNQPENAKSVVVSQWTALLDIVAVHLKAAGISFCQISGNVPVNKRNQIVEDFNGTSSNGPLVMLLSLKAGGVGLNLIGGSHLFLLDLHWNPALESQAADRIHRMGQTKDVHIYRFICNDTIERNIITIQNKKLQLANNVITGGATASASKLTLSDLKILFGMRY